jgi:hypothetical protein
MEPCDADSMSYKELQQIAKQLDNNIKLNSKKTVLLAMVKQTLMKQAAEPEAEPEATFLVETKVESKPESESESDSKTEFSSEPVTQVVHDIHGRKTTYTVTTTRTGNSLYSRH